VGPSQTRSPRRDAGITSAWTRYRAARPATCAGVGGGAARGLAPHRSRARVDLVQRARERRRSRAATGGDRFARAQHEPGAGARSRSGRARPDLAGEPAQPPIPGGRCRCRGSRRRETLDASRRRVPRRGPPRVVRPARSPPTGTRPRDRSPTRLEVSGSATAGAARWTVAFARPHVRPVTGQPRRRDNAVHPAAGLLCRRFR